jgi:CheY-like chemotaxis protein
MKTVLLVDDEFALVEVLTSVMEEEGLRVIAASNGLEGLERLGEGLPDVALVDVMMPRMGGPELLEKMRADPRLAGIPVILMSAAERMAKLVDGAGAAAFLHKPFRVPTLLATLHKVIGAW